MSVFLALLLMGFAAIFQAAFLLRRENPRDPASPWLLLAASLLLLESLVQKSLRMRAAAVLGLHESVLLLSAAVCALLFVLRRARRTRALHPLVMLAGTLASLALLMVSRSSLLSRDMPHPPALPAPWLVLHVVITVISESFFTVAFIAGAGFLASRKDETRAALDRLTEISVSIGYPLFTIGALVFGAVWAKAAWGAWWSWDPKVMAALATWFVYTGFVLSRIVTKRSGTVSALFAVVGYLAALYTFFGVNYLLPGLHTFQ